jgi:hypothetical protein
MRRWYDAGLVRRLREAAKQRAKRSGVKGFQNRWWSAPRTSGRNVFLLLWLSTIAIRAMLERLGQPMGVEVVTGSATLAFTGMALERAKQLRKALAMSFERAQSYFYPVSEKEFLQRTVFRSALSAWWLVAAGVGLFRMLQEANTPMVWTTAVLGGFAEVLAVLSLVYALEEHLEVIPRWLGLGFFGMAVLWLFTPQRLAVGQQMWVNLLPTGWASVVVTSRWFSAPARIAALAGGVAVFGAAAWMLARRRCAKLLDEFARSWTVEPEHAAAASEMAGAPSASWRVLQEPLTELHESELEDGSVVERLPMQATWRRQRIAAIGSEWAEFVNSGEWLQPWNWKQMPWMERAVGWWLTPEERVTLRFMTGGKTPQWSNGWKNAVMALAAGVLLVAVLPGEWTVLGGIVLLVSVGLGLPLGGGRWIATDRGWVSGKLSPLYSAYALGYGRAGRVMAKVGLVRTVAFLPLLAVLAVVAAKLQNAGVGQGLWQATRVLAVWLSWLPLTLAGKFSKGTNDSTNLRASLVLVVPLVIVMMVLMVILWGMVLMTESA